MKELPLERLVKLKYVEGTPGDYDSRPLWFDFTRRLGGEGEIDMVDPDYDLWIHHPPTANCASRRQKTNKIDEWADTGAIKSGQPTQLLAFFEPTGQDYGIR